MTAFYVAWTEPNGTRAHGPTGFTREMASNVATELNAPERGARRSCEGGYVVVPADKLAEWKAGTWAP